MKTILIFTTAGLLASCTTSNFTPYEGAQNWPVSQGALVDRKYAVPVYYGPPPQPYIVMGSLDVGNTTAGTEVGAAANKAKQLGADAIIVMRHGTSQVGTYSTGSATAYGYGNTQRPTGQGSAFRSSQEPHQLRLFAGRDDQLTTRLRSPAAQRSSWRRF